MVDLTDKRWIGAGLAGGLVALGLAAAGAFVARGLEYARAGDRIVTVRGVSERIVKADLAMLPLRFAAANNDLAVAQRDVETDLGKVRAFLAQEGYGPAEVSLGRFEVVDQFAREYQQSNVSTRYQVAQTVIVRTGAVDKVEATSRRLNELVRAGVVLQDFRGPSFIFTRLNDVRAPMIAEATSSARSGAQQFARDSQSTLGGIREATQGSFEILGRDEVGDESSQVFKKVRVVTTIQYQLR